MHRGIPIRSSTRLFEDSALTWARNHTVEAQACLNAPEFTTRHNHHLLADVPTTLENYLLHRNWQTDSEHKRSLISHVLSAPLTASHILSKAKPNTVGCFVGARSEASLPHYYWLELLDLISLDNRDSDRLRLHFTGPELTRRPDVSIFTKAQLNSSVTLTWHAPGKYHDLADDLVASFDVLIFLNPGFGHPNLIDDWHPTLPMTKPTLVTAHSELDADRDQRFLKTMYGIEIDYKINPFASRIKYLDPVSKDKEHYVQPNLLYGIYLPM